jgi:hypothetical protein
LADRPQRGTERLGTVLELWNFGITADMPREITDSRPEPSEGVSLFTIVPTHLAWRRAWKRAHRDVEARPAAPTPG